MKSQCPEKQETGSGALLELAERNLARVLAGLDEAIAEIEARQTGAEARAKATAIDLRKALQTVFDERQRIEKLDSRIADGGGGAGFDLDAARAEIGRRLDRLRQHGGAGGTSGEPDG